jgi:hypothetical protein
MKLLKLASVFMLAIALGACGGGGGNPGTNVNPELTVLAPSVVKLTPGSSQTYQISGGTSPYTAVSDNTSRVTAVVSGNTVVLSAVAIGDAIVAVFDTAGTKVSISVTVGL